MNAIRKALLPSGIALAFLLFLGSVGSTSTASASMVYEGSVCGTEYVSVGSESAYWIVLYDYDDDRDGEIGANVNGKGHITAKLDGDGFLDYEPANTAHIASLDVEEIGDLEPGLVAFLVGHLGFDLDCDTDIVIVGQHPHEIALVTVECRAVGTFVVSFYATGSDDINGSMTVYCVDAPDSATITARPTTVEIAPSYANVAHSLITVLLWDDEDEPAFPGDNVLFYTDRCAIETSAVNTPSEYNEARVLFAALHPLLPSTARDIEESDAATTAPDSNRQQDEVVSFKAGGDSSNTVAAAILHCDPIHAPGVTPGVANITAVVDVNDPDGGDNDIIVKTTVKVVGPPAPNGVTVTASPATLMCGEKATITVDVKDSIGQPVSDHTLIEAVTNAGGVLGGTGAVIGWGGPVVPMSSTIAETFGGKATLYLLTSTSHVGKYEVVVTTGGGGGVTGLLYGSREYGRDYVNVLGGLFTTAPISVQVTVECNVPAPAPAPTTTGPTTGTGTIKPPSTGDAGLASSNSSTSLTLIAGAVVAAATLGLVVKKVAADKIS